jgi:tryptophan synthase alpha chain
MSRIDDLFVSLRAAGQKAFRPFVTAGDPDLKFTAAFLRELSARGANLFEIGIPYSDPIADGPVIQSSYTRALQHDVHVADILDTLRDVCPQVDAPLVSMVSYSIVYRHGLQRYVAEARAAGLAGAIVPDLPVEESDELASICRREDFSLIQLATPTTARDRALRIASSRTRFGDCICKALQPIDGPTVTIGR